MTQDTKVNTLRYTAQRVVSDIPSRYRLIGPAAPDEKGTPHPRYRWPDKVILVLESEHRWLPVVTLSVSVMQPGRLMTNATGMTVEDLK